MGAYGADGVGDNDDDDDDGVDVVANMLMMVTIKASMVTATVEKWCLWL